MFRISKWFGAVLSVISAVALSNPASAFHGHHAGHVHISSYGYGGYYGYGAPLYYPSHSRMMSSYWGGLPSYAPYSLFPAPRVTYTSYYRSVYYRPLWRPLCLVRRPVVVSTYSPIVYSPIYYSVPSPTYVPAVPSCCDGGSVIESDVIHSVSNPSSIDRAALMSSSVVDVRSQLTSPSIVLPRPVDVSVDNVAGTGHFVSSSSVSSSLGSSQAAVQNSVPADLIQTVDAMFQSGRYSEAAAAYARLAVFFGDCDALTARRFAAQVAAGDCNQAAVIYELAMAQQRPIAASEMPAGGLKGLYGSRHNDRASHVDRLALAALENPSDPVPLAMVGTWLILDGQADRAEPLLRKAAALQGSDSDSEPPASAPLLARTLKIE